MHYYLSFADHDCPKGEQFLGATIVEAASPKGAVEESHRRKLNPGGEVLIVPLPKYNLDQDPLHLLNRFGTAKEVLSVPCKKIDV